MDDTFRLFPESASSIAHRVDALFLTLVGIAVFFSLLICTLILYYGIRYRRRAKVKRGNPALNTSLELTWVAVPFVIMMALFAWGGAVYYDMHTPPDNAMELSVVGKQWMWKVQHPEGAAEINTLHVPVGQPVKLRMISEDVIHSFYIPAFRVKQDVLPGYYTTMWFTPTKAGTYHLFCAEYCGTDHSHMRGRVVVMGQAEYAEWLSQQKGPPPEVLGKRLFDRYRCTGCHRLTQRGTGPPLSGLFGRRVPLSGGGTVVVDEQYLRDSIRNPSKHVVAGYQRLMPSYSTSDLSEAKVMYIVAYIKSLTGPSPSAKRQP